jgi:hypothetical protein
MADGRNNQCLAYASVFPKIERASFSQDVSSLFAGEEYKT